MVTAIMIVEIMGRPPEHLRKSLEEHIGKLDSVKGVEVINKDFSDTKEVEVDEKTPETRGLFTCFCEVEFSVESLAQLANVMFDFMPASIEVVDPSQITLSPEEATGFMNNLTGRLHRYDDVVKILKNQEIAMNQKFGLAQKLLYEYGIIDKEGKILKIPEGMKKKGENKEEKKEGGDKEDGKGNCSKKEGDDKKENKDGEKDDAKSKNKKKSKSKKSKK